MFSALSQIAKHSVDLAEMVVEAEIFPTSFACLKDHDEYVRKNCATLIREVARHTPEVINYQINKKKRNFFLKKKKFFFSWLNY